MFRENAIFVMTLESMIQVDNFLETIKLDTKVIEVPVIYCVVRLEEAVNERGWRLLIGIFHIAIATGGTDGKKSMEAR